MLTYMYTIYWWHIAQLYYMYDLCSHICILSIDDTYPNSIICMIYAHIYVYYLLMTHSPTLLYVWSMLTYMYTIYWWHISQLYYMYDLCLHICILSIDDTYPNSSICMIYAHIYVYYLLMTHIPTILYVWSMLTYMYTIYWWHIAQLYYMYDLCSHTCILSIDDT